ncbi:MAG: hypothetical protein GYA46_11210 [candidate division Zixibacteria bacterium]|nr:hypothetical protein [candidate division Zixibacteria bacterium]
MGRIVILWLATIFMVIGISPVTAQNITVTNNLVFGNIFPGIPKAVPKTDAGAAAEFFVSGVAGNEVSIEFTLPRYMNDGGLNMQLVFTETDCAMDSSATPSQGSPGYNNLDPWHPITYRLGSAGLTIWLGGMVIPKLNQPPGDYAGTIVLTVTYTGN